MALALMAKAFKINYSTPTNNNQMISSNPRNMHIAQPGMNMGLDRQMQMVGGNGKNQFRQFAWQNVENLNGYNAVQNVGNQVAQNAIQNPRVQNVGNQNGLIGVPRNANQNGNGNLVATRAEGNAAGHNGNQIRCYNCRGVDLVEIEEVNENCILMANLQQASTLGTQTDKAPVYDSDGSAEYTELLEPIPESHKVPENDNDVISEVSVQKDNTHSTSTNTKFAKQSILGKPPKLGETHALPKLVTLSSTSTPQESKVVKNDKVIAPGMFRINHFKTSREEKHVPNIVRASARTKLITVSQPPVFTKKDVNSDSNGLSFTGIDNTKTRRPQPRSNTQNDRVTSASKSSCNKNKGVEVEEHHRNLLLSKNKKHMSSACNNVKFDSQNVKSKVVCDMCKQCLISVNHDVCLLNYVNGKTSRGKKQKASVSIIEKQKKQQPKVKKTKKVGFIKRLATPKPSKPRFYLRWSPTGRMFDLKGKIITSSESESQSDCSNDDNACASNPLEPKIKRFPNSTSFLARLSKFVYGVSTRVVPST
nr:hypothetical protein [Tanacetum cinerariifolium]